jgi:hypothetical protein
MIKKNYTERTHQTRNWLRDKVRHLGGTRANRPTRVTMETGLAKARTEIISEPSRYTGTTVGRMMFFFYDPKTKDKLPYYDTFPLVFPIEYYSDGFLGLNIHYLDIGNRLLLLDRLAEYRTSKTINPSTVLKLSYDLIASTSRLTIAEPCIKRYLYSHVRSKFIEVYPQEWDIAAMLPVQQFHKATNRHVWNESRRQF